MPLPHPVHQTFDLVTPLASPAYPGRSQPAGNALRRISSSPKLLVFPRRCKDYGNVLKGRERAKMPPPSPSHLCLTPINMAVIATKVRTYENSIFCLSAHIASRTILATRASHQCAGLRKCKGAVPTYSISTWVAMAITENADR